MATKLGRFLLESDITDKKAGNTITVKTEAEAQKLTGLPKGTIVRALDTGSFFEDGKQVGSAVNVTELSGPVDYNTLTRTGVYHQGSYNNARASTNGASVNPGLLEVFAGTGVVYQRFTVYRDGGIYTRSYYAYTDTWYPWRKLLTE